MVSVMGAQVLFHRSHHKERNMENSLYFVLLKKPVSVTDRLQDMFLWVYTICKLPFYADYNYQQIRTSYVSQSQAPSPPPAPARILKSFPLHGSGCCWSGRPTVMMTIYVLTNTGLRSQPCTRAVLCKTEVKFVPQMKCWSGPLCLLFNLILSHSPYFLSV